MVAHRTEFTFEGARVGAMLQKMHAERKLVAMIAARGRVVDRAFFTGVGFISQTGAINQREWNKWRMA